VCVEFARSVAVGSCQKGDVCLKYASNVALAFVVITVLFSSLTSGFSLSFYSNTHLSAPSSQGLQVWFDGSPQLIMMYPTNYEFHVVAETSSGLWITDLHWDFGDNSTLDVPFSAQSQVSDMRFHAYSPPGIYTVTVTAYDNTGNSGNGQVTVNWSTEQQQDPTTFTIICQFRGLSVLPPGVTSDSDLIFFNFESHAFVAGQRNSADSLNAY
jgi:hypothetical protein